MDQAIVTKRINQLPREVADKIAAGEVVTRPLSIVKELLENAIDAGATSISVEIRNGGKSYIRVTDDGCGIAKEDAELAFMRHATSKILQATDLDHITTLGFRGEALASIAAVSRTELITKTRQEKSGIKILVEGGILSEKVDTGCPDGTTIIVSDLFYNTPARLKFMKGDNTESTLIIDFISKMALAYPRIKMRMVNNGNILFSTPGKGDIYTNILTIYSKEIGEKLLYMKEQGPGMAVEGYISPPSQTRSNRKSQIFFVNGRHISSKIMENALGDAYAEKLFEGRHPIAFLFLTIEPEKLDVNIHPNKKEVRFDDEKAVRAFLASAIANCLKTREAVPEITGESLFKRAIAKQSREDYLKKAETTEMTAGMGAVKAAEAEPPGKGKTSLPESANNIKIIPQAGTETKEEQVDIKTLLSLKRREQQESEKGVTIEIITESDTGDETVAGPSGSPEPANKDIGNSANSGVQPSFADNVVPEENMQVLSMTGSALVQEEPGVYKIEKGLDLHIAEVKKRPFEIESIVATGSIFGTYITGVDDNSFYLIDQHAAHERIFYEQLLAQYYAEEKHSQLILTPIVKEVTFAVKNDEYDWLDCLSNMGFGIEEFGVKSYIVKEIPMLMTIEEAEDFLNYFLDGISDGVNLEDPKKLDKIITRSCKQAVKAHDLLDKKEIDRLLKDLAKARNPFSCPHGRPTIIRMTKREIEKLFKRV